MNAPDLLLDDALGQLDDPRRQQLDQEAATDAALADRRQRLRQAVALLVDDDQTIVPPIGLAARTVAAVAGRRRRRSLLDFVPATVPFRWPDVAVAAGIFLAGTLTLIPAAYRDRMRMAEVTCTANLQQVGSGLFRYATSHDSYPYVEPDCPGSYVGAFAMQLHDDGLITDGTPLHCPSCNRPTPASAHLISFQTLCDQEARVRGAGRSAILANDYAYHLGYRDGFGHPGPIQPASLPAAVPLLADQPPHDAGGRILPGNSPNHGGSGQNVLFSDLHAAWRRSRWNSPSDPDIFLNNEDHPAPGTNWRDSVLVPADFRYRRTGAQD
jgi:hypothetical protein